MGRTYGVPRSAKGESRFLYVFTLKSTFTTLIGAGIGFLFYLLCSALGASIIGIIIVGIFGLIGFGVGTLSSQDSPIVGNLRKAGGEQISEILLRTLTFGRRKKIYVYREGDKK